MFLWLVCARTSLNSSILIALAVKLPAHLSLHHIHRLESWYEVPYCSKQLALLAICHVADMNSWFSYRYASKAKNTNYIRVKSPTCNDSITNNGLK